MLICFSNDLKKIFAGSEEMKQKSKMLSMVTVIALLLLASSLTPSAAALGKGHPDLKISEFTATVGSPLENRQTPVTLQWTVNNLGKKPSGPFDIQIDFSESSLVQIIHYEELLPQSALSDEETINLPPGEYIFSLVVDPENKIREVSENNNEMSVAVSVPVPPSHNLKVGDVEYCCSSGGHYLKVGDPVGVSFTVTNNEKSVINEAQIEVKLNEETVIIEMTVGPLAPGESLRVQGLSNYKFDAPGEYKLEVVADPNNLISETAEWDNYGKTLVYVYPVILSNIALSNCFAWGGSQPPGYALLGDPISISCDIENNGGQPAYDFYFLVSKEGELIFSEVLNLNPGEKKTITANTNHIFATSGSVTVEFNANPWFEETTREDNVIHQKVYIRPPPILP